MYVDYVQGQPAWFSLQIKQELHDMVFSFCDAS